MIIDKLFDNAALNWRKNKGVGTALVPAPFDDKVLVYHTLTCVYGTHADLSTIIITDDFQQRMDIIEFLTHQENEENNTEFKKLLESNIIKVITSHFVLTNRFTAIASLVIWYRPTEYNPAIAHYLDRSKFKLVIINKLFNNQHDLANLYKLAPILECFKQAEIDEIRVSSPVEEMWIGVDIEEDIKFKKLYDFYSKYIETSINIFGSFDIMQKARIGNEILNISAAEICSQIARENGWNEHLDMSYEFNQSIDELYNPNNLRDRATQTYEMIRKRSNLVSDYEGKLEKILEIVKTCSGDKILIINKRGEFASIVTDYINSNSETDICGNYHNKLDNIEAIDVEGNPVFVKTGKEKGKRKVMSYKAQMTLNEKKFNLNKLSCLSLSNSPDKSLNVGIDTIIITSPLCEDIKSYLYRLSNINLNNGKIKLFSIFCKNTIEQQKLFNKSTEKTHIIVNKDEIVSGLENNYDFVIAD